MEFTGIEQHIERLGGLEVDDWAGLAVSEHDLRRIESHAGHPLPASYRAFLTRYGGGDSSFKRVIRFPVAGHGGGWSGLNVFHGAAVPEGERHFGVTALMAEHARDLPPGMVPIGGDGGGNRLCLCVAGPQAGAVFFWDHEAVEDYGLPASYDEYIPVAPSFEAFLSLIEIDHAGDLERQTFEAEMRALDSAPDAQRQ